MSPPPLPKRIKHKKQMTNDKWQLIKLGLKKILKRFQNQRWEFIKENTLSTKNATKKKNNNGREKNLKTRSRQRKLDSRKNDNSQEKKRKEMEDAN